MTTIIKDTLTNQFYCIEMTEIGRDGQLTCGPNDFPFWSDDITEACEFPSILYAQHEMRHNDLTCDGERNPIIVDEYGIEIPNLYLIDANGNYHLQPLSE